MSEQGRIYLQIDPDIYSLVRSMEGEVRRVIEERELAGKVDWVKIRQLLKKPSGTAEDVTL